MIILLFRHGMYNHTEEWRNVNGQVLVEFDCPLNSPPRGKHIMSPAQAMRQYILMCGEGWVPYDTGWRKFVDELEV